MLSLFKSFEKMFEVQFDSFNGNIKYYKKVTTFKGTEEKQPTVEELKNQLQEAIKEEKFELAIKLRDQIKKKRGLKIPLFI